jgi:AcrR family transcriptional regulator
VSAASGPSRTCGVKPVDPASRAAAVEAAVRTLEKIGATFTVADVAERSGVSRATIYRSSDLRKIVGARGDGKRPVDADVHARLAERHASAKAASRDLRRRLMDAERGWEEMRSRALTAERRLREAELRLKALETMQMRANPDSPLGGIAGRLGPEAMRRARRRIARALHPDLFVKDAETHALATELLKAINALAE